MICFIPSAGLGTRMGELTKDLPKPLLRIGNIPLIYYSIVQSIKWGINEFYINTYYKKEQIKDELKKIENLKINISEEEKLLGGLGGICTALQFYQNIDEYCLIINPDTLFFPAKNFVPLPKDYNGKCLLYLKENLQNESYSKIELINSKIKFGSGKYYYIGLGIIKVELLKEYFPNVKYEFIDLFKKLSDQNLLDGLVFEGPIIDVGEKEKFEFYQNKHFNLKKDKKIWQELGF